jgi:hypothetical protein
MARPNPETPKSLRFTADPETAGALGALADPEPRPEETSHVPDAPPEDATPTAMLGSVLAWALFRSAEPPSKLQNLPARQADHARPSDDGEDFPETSNSGAADMTAPLLQGGGATFEDVPLALAFERLSTQGTLTRQGSRSPLDDQAEVLGRNATTLLTVAKGEQPPEAMSDRVLTSIADGSTITIPIAALLANDRDADAAGSMAFDLVDGSTSGGNAVIEADAVVFTPQAGPFTTGTFSYTISDGKLTSAPVSVTLSAAGTGKLAGDPGPAILLGDDLTVSISTVGNARLGGLSFGDDDLVAYDPSSDAATLLFDGGASFSNTREDIDAFQLLSDGRIVLSTVGNARLGGLSFGDDDLVAYDPTSDTASLFFDGGSVFSNTREDIDALYLLSDGRIVLSTVGNARLGGLSFGDDDLVAYDPIAEMASPFFDGGASFSNSSEDINAFDLLPGGLIVLSTIGDATLGGLSFGDDDLVAYDPLRDTAKLLFDGGSLFANAREDINAASLHGSELIAGSAGDDWIDGGFGVDSLEAGDGDDILIWDSADFRVEGGSGLDTLRVEAGDVGLSGFTGTITGIDRIDLAGDLGANSAILDARDVLDISDDQVITLLGDASDRVDAGAGWSDGGLDGLGYQIYTQTLGSSVATLLVDPALSVNPDILS